jgi:hypothetical protein
MALGGLTGSPLNTISSINGLGSTGLTHNGTGLDALTSPYTGIQQYAGMTVAAVAKGNRQNGSCNLFVELFEIIPRFNLSGWMLLQ